MESFDKYINANSESDAQLLVALADLIYQCVINKIRIDIECSDGKVKITYYGSNLIEFQSAIQSMPKSVAVDAVRYDSCMVLRMSIPITGAEPEKAEAATEKAEAASAE